MYSLLLLIGGKYGTFTNWFIGEPPIASLRLAFCYKNQTGSLSSMPQTGSKLSKGKGALTLDGSSP